LKSEKSAKLVLLACFIIFIKIVGIAVNYGFTAKTVKIFVLTVSQEWLDGFT